MLEELKQIAKSRRSIRRFSNKKIDMNVIKTCVEIAGTAPSGANKQPWSFAVITNNDLKAEIRRQAEEIETELYEHKISDEWREDLSHLETNAVKEFLTEAPVLIVVFKQITGEQGEKHYYVNESVGLATGMLIQALNVAGIETLTYTPSPMEFLTKLLDRPNHERAFMLLACGYRKEEYIPIQVDKKDLSELVKEYK